MEPRVKRDTGKRAVRIGGASGFWGDSRLGPIQLVRHGSVNYLVFDYLAELTMSLLARARQRQPGEGYATDFVTVALRSVLAEAIGKGIRIVSNAGGVNPRGCRSAVEALAAELGVSLRVAVVEGDDVLPIVPQLQASGALKTPDGRALPAELASANAYLGALPIARALDAGADIVVTGRCVDSAVTLGVLMHEFGWGAQDYDRLAAGSLAGHILECGCQATGGLYTDWRRVPRWEDIGYPIVECRPDGDFFVTKPPGTGGLVLPSTVGEQLLYEIGDPADYRLPDVVCDFRQVQLRQLEPDVVAVAGVRGRPPSDTYKVSATFQSGFRTTAVMTIIGIDAAAKAQRTGESLIERGRRLLVERGAADFTAAHIELLGTESSYGAQARHRDSREVVLRLTVNHVDKSALEAFSREFAAPGTSWAPGTTGFSGRPNVSPVLEQFSFLLDKALVSPKVVFAGESTSVPSPVNDPQIAPAPIVAHEETVGPGPRRIVPLVRIAWGRSGDKGDVSNIGLLARTPALYAVLKQEVTAERVAAHLAHLVRGPVSRYELPGVHGINLVCEQALAGGGMASPRNDALGKGMAQLLLDLPVNVPEQLLPAEA
jgi:hypothetical protein